MFPVRLKLGQDHLELVGKLTFHYSPLLLVNGGSGVSKLKIGNTLLFVDLEGRLSI